MTIPGRRLDDISKKYQARRVAGHSDILGVA